MPQAAAHLEGWTSAKRTEKLSTAITTRVHPPTTQQQQS